MEEINILKKKKIYFASDFHLGAADDKKTGNREKKICCWLDEIKHDAQVVFLVGDLFDFWFEHRLVMPKGFSRFFGKLAELSDAGIRLIIFQGNHDMWMSDYFKEEFEAEVYREPREYLINGKTFFIGHGDGLGPGDYFYKIVKVFFENKMCRWLFGHLLHPDLSLGLGRAWAEYSWKRHPKTEKSSGPLVVDKEILYHYCLEIEQRQPHDFYIFGHRHLKIDVPISSTARYVNLGDFISYFSYAVFDGDSLQLLDFIEDPTS